MTPAARVQSAIEILDLIVVAARGQGAPADRLLSEWFRTHRFAGSKDKRAIRELVYGAIRACGPVPDTGRAAMLRLAQDDPEVSAAFDGSPYGPAPLAPGEAVAAGGLAPQWLEERLRASGIVGDEAAGLLGRAPLDLRINRLRSGPGTPQLPVPAQPLALPDAVRVPTGERVEQWDAYERGIVEIQDLGSQLACAAVQAQPGETVIDLCAGAGGKTLALAAAMENAGTLIAADTDRARLSRLAPRAERAGAVIAETILLDPGKEAAALSAWQGRADAVLIDAPCSGTGTWRRNPEARWRLTPRELERLAALQARLLDVAAGLVQPGGRIVYVVCSLLDEEGAQQIARFLQANPAWQARPVPWALGTTQGHGTRLTPHRDGTDGFFIACIGMV